MIPNFPNFEKIELKHKADFKNYTSQASDLLFTNLFSWSVVRNYEISSSNNNIIIKNIEDTKTKFSILGNNEFKKTLEILFSNSKNCIIKTITEEQLKLIHSNINQYNIQEDRDNFDYIYLREKLAELKGTEYAQKRNHLNYFLKNIKFEYKELTKQYIEGCENLMDAWCEEHKDHDHDKMALLDCEAALNCLDHFLDLDIFGAVILVDNKVIAFTIAEKLNEETAVIHFEKADTDVRGSYQAINQLFCKNSLNSFKFINREQDLGDENLKKSKLACRPISFIKKYIATQKE